MHFNVSVTFDYNISQYIHMSDKWWRLSEFSSEFLHNNTGNGEIPLNPRPKRPWFAVFFVLYDFFVLCVLYKCVAWMLYFPCFMISLPFSFRFLRTEIKTGLAWYKHLPGFGQSCNQIARTLYLLEFPAGFPTWVLLQNYLSLTSSFPLFWKSKCCCGSFWEN